MLSHTHRCCFRPFAKGPNLIPAGPQCANIAVYRLEWKDGRISMACRIHGARSLICDGRREFKRQVRLCRTCGADVRSPSSWYCEPCNQKRPGYGKLCSICHAEPTRSPTDSYCRDCDNFKRGTGICAGK
jgi:hypothetical protein